MSQCQ